MNDTKENIRLLDWVLLETPIPPKLVSDTDKEHVMQVFKDRLWRTPVSMGIRGTLSSPLIIDGLRYEPLDFKKCNIPSAAWKRINTILKSGVSSQEFYIGHEIVASEPGVQIPWKLIGKIATIAVGVVAAIGVFMAIASAVIMLISAVVTILLPLVFLVALAAGVDPKIVYRTSEGEWLDIFTYYL